MADSDTLQPGAEVDARGVVESIDGYGVTLRFGTDGANSACRAYIPRASVRPVSVPSEGAVEAVAQAIAPSLFTERATKLHDHAFVATGLLGAAREQARAAIAALDEYRRAHPGEGWSVPGFYTPDGISAATSKANADRTKLQRKAAAFLRTMARNPMYAGCPQLADAVDPDLSEEKR